MGPVSSRPDRQATPVDRPPGLAELTEAMGNSRDEGQAILLPLEAEAKAPRGRGIRWVLLAATLAAGMILASPLPLWLRPIGVAGVLLVALLAVLLLHARRSSSTRTRSAPRRHGASIAVDDQGIWRLGSEGEAATIARWDETFGLTVLANPSLSRAVLAFTSAERTRLVAVRIESGADTERLLHQAVPVTDADLDDALAGPRHGCLSGKSAARLFGEVSKRAQAAVGSLYLFDASGAKVTLEGDLLGALEKIIDLSDPVEWRSFTFHEAGASGSAMMALTFYQATWVRQGANELFLVCPIPAEASSLGLGRPSDPPPDRENRVAVDRLFMIPLRKALEGAPRISRVGLPARRSSHAIPTPTQ
jgi:hypothetical protein